MSYGGIDFEHVWAYQIKCMMANQYDRLIEAIAKNDPDLIIVGGAITRAEDPAAMAKAFKEAIS